MVAMFDVRRDLKTVLYAYGIVGAARSTLVLAGVVRKRKRRSTGSTGSTSSTSQSVSRRPSKGHLQPWHDSLTLSLAAFPVALRRSFAIAHSWYPDSIGMPSFLCSPAILLLPSEWRIQLALYAITSAMVSLKRPPAVDRFLPPFWTLNCLANGVLIMLVLTTEHGIQPAYEKIIFDHSENYIPRGKTKSEIVKLLQTTDYPKITREQARALNPPAHPLHTRLVCATMHPDTPSCLENFLASFVHESSKVWKWMGMFGVAAVVLKQRTGVMKHPWSAFRQWFSYTLRSTLFCVGSISTSWGLICLLQRILPGRTLPRSRYLINGIISSLWILALPPSRRKDISLYAARFAALNLYQTIKRETGMSIPYGEVPLFALALTSLIRSRESGIRISGISSLLLKGVEV